MRAILLFILCSTMQLWRYNKMNYFNLNLPLFKLNSEGKMVIPPNTDSIWYDLSKQTVQPWVMGASCRG